MGEGWELVVPAKRKGHMGRISRVARDQQRVAVPCRPGGGRVAERRPRQVISTVHSGGTSTRAWRSACTLCRCACASDASRGEFWVRTGCERQKCCIMIKIAGESHAFCENVAAAWNFSEA